MARVYAEVNENMPRSYWDYDSVNISMYIHCRSPPNSCNENHVGIVVMHSINPVLCIVVLIS